MPSQPSRDEQTSQFYASTAETYVASGPGGTSRFLQTFMDMLPTGSRVLELDTAADVMRRP